LPSSIVFYNTHRTGFDEPVTSTAQLISSLALLVAVAGTIGMLGALLRRNGDRDRIRSFIVRTGLTVFSALLVLELLRPLRKGGWDGSPFRALPVLLLVIIVIAWRGRRGQNDDQPDVAGPLFLISVFSLAILARVVLRVPSGGAYGAFFLPTSLLLTCYIFCEGFPAWTTKRTLDPVLGGYLRTGGRALLLALLATTAVVFSSRYRRSYSTLVEAQHGRFLQRLPSSSHPAIGGAIQHSLRLSMDDS
jgi:hypothetical protein